MGKHLLSFSNTMFRSSKRMIQILMLFPFAAHATSGIKFWQCEHREWVDQIHDKCDRDGVDPSQPACKPNIWLCKKNNWNVFAKKVCQDAKTQCNLGYASRKPDAKKHLSFDAMLKAKQDVTTAMFNGCSSATTDAKGNVVDADGN